MTGRQWYYLDGSGVKHGPIGEAELFARIRKGDLPRWTKVRFEGMNSVQFLRADAIPYVESKLGSRAAYEDVLSGGVPRPPEGHVLNGHHLDAGSCETVSSQKKVTTLLEMVWRVALLAILIVGPIVAVAVVFADETALNLLISGALLIAVPIAVLFLFGCAAIIGAAITLPLRLVLEEEPWKRTAAIASFVLWIVFGFLFFVR